jgi:hypothetical protein
MSLIRSGFAAAKRWGLLAVLFSALLALSLFHPSVVAAQEVKHIKLTEKHMQGRLDEYRHRPFRRRPADQDLYRATRSDKEGDQFD